MKSIINNINKLFNDLYFFLKYVFLAMRVYGIVAILTCIVFGVFGIYPITRVIITKIQTANELKKNNLIMEDNIKKLAVVRTQLQDNSLYIDYLNSYVPLNPDTQLYLLEFVNAVGKAGYSVKSFAQGDSPSSDKSITELNILMEGTQYPTTLIHQVESLNRVTNVKRTVFFSDTRLDVTTYTVNMTVQIYSYVAR